MPHYEFICHTCKKVFSKIVSLVDYDEGDVRCTTAAARMSSNAGPGSARSRRRRALDDLGEGRVGVGIWAFGT